MGGYWHMDADRVQQLAAAADGVAETVPGRSTSAWTTTEQASAAAGQGLVSAAALDACLTAWSVQWRHLHDEVSRSATDLKASAASCRAVETRNGSMFDHLASTLTPIESAFRHIADAL